MFKTQLRRGAVAFATLLMTLVLFQATPASANVSTPLGGVASAYFTCDDQNNQLSYGITVYPETGRASQTVAFRIYAQNVASGAGSWTSWRIGTTGPYPGQQYGYDNIVILPELPLHRFYVQYGWWTPTRWRFAVERITEYLQVGWYGGAYYGTFLYCDI